MPLQRLSTINAATCPPGTVVYSACAANLPATGGETSSYTYALAFDSLLARPAQTSTAMTSGVSNTDSSTNLHVNDATANLALSSVNSGVHDTIGFKLPIGYGWFNLDNNIPGAQTQPTNRVSQCPPNAKLNAGYEGCPSGVFAYSGAVYDIKRNRMIIWGGGDQDYFGNEIYEVNLTGTPKWTRLTRATDSPVYSSFSTYRDPKTGAAMDCSGAGYNAMRRAQIETIPGGQVIPGLTVLPAGVMPNSRHTYGGLVYFPDSDQMISAGTGAMAACRGVGGYFTWALDMGSIASAPANPDAVSPSWHILNSNGTPNGGAGQFMKVTSAVYDPVLHTLFVADEASQSLSTQGIYKYRTSAKDYIKIAGTAALGSHPLGESLVLDPKRRRLLAWQHEVISSNGRIPPEFQIFDISSVTATGVETLDPDKQVRRPPFDDASCGNGARGGGFRSVVVSMAYDPIFELIAVYPGAGGTLYLFNPDEQNSVEAGSYGTVPPGKCLPISYGRTKGRDYPTDGSYQGSHSTLYSATYGRFAYVPDADVFLYLPDAHAPAWILRLERKQ